MSKYKLKNRSWRKYIAWFNAIVIFLIPLVVFFKIIHVQEEYRWLLGNQETVIDFFAYYKAKILQFGAIISLSLTLYFKIKEGWKFKWDKYTVLLSLFAFSIIISTLLSEHKMIAIFGYPDRFEGAWSWLSYLMFSYSIYLFIESKQDVLNIVRAFVYATGVAALIGAFQHAGMDFFKTEIGKMLILGSNYAQFGEHLIFRVAEGTSYTTLYNSNNVGTMVAMVIPLIFYVFKVSEDWKEKSLLLIIFVLNIITLIGSKSTGGLVATALILLILFFMYIYKNFSKKILMVIILGLCSLIFFVTNTDRMTRTIEKVLDLGDINVEQEAYFKEIKILGNEIIVTSVDNKSITLSHDNTNFYVYDSNGDLISSEMNKDGILFAAKGKMVNWQIRYFLNSNTVMVMYRPDEFTGFQYIELGVIKNGFSLFGRQIESEFESVDVFKFISNEAAFSKRAYIWNRSIPMIVNRCIFGYGADNFAIHFPQMDLIGKSSIYFKSSIIVDKVHSLYFNILINFGVSGFLIFLVLLVNSFKKMFKLPLLLISVVGILITGLVYDSTVYMTTMLFLLISIRSKYGIE